MTYTVVAVIISVGILAVDLAVALSGAVLVPVLVLLVVLFVTVLFIRSQHSASLEIHENGLALRHSRKCEIVLWSDIAEIKPTFSYVAAPATVIDIAIVRRSGGRVVLHNNWVPRSEFLALVQELVFSAGENPAV